jgi:hypothetical protein
MRDEEILVVGLGSGIRVAPVDDGRVIFARPVKAIWSYTLRMLTRADGESFSFGIFRALSPSSETV